MIPTRPALAGLALALGLAADALHAQSLDPAVAGRDAMQLAVKALGDEARDLVFIPITPCTVWDTRFASNPDSAGVIANGATKRFYSHLDGAGGSYAPYGGNASCPEAAQSHIGHRPYAVMMTVYINNPTAQGWLTLYRDGDPDPSQATISVYYSPGPTRTQTVISKSSRGYGTGAYDVAATSRFADTHASAAVTGYFVKATPRGNLDLVDSTASDGNILKAGSRFIHNYGNGNTFLGVSAGNFSMTGENNSAHGAQALMFNTTGAMNAAFGTSALRANTTGGANIAVGPYALQANTSGQGNTAAGASALYANTNGTGNTAYGGGAMSNNTGGNFNTAIGYSALLGNTSGSQNTAIGLQALMNAAGATNGNIAIGSGAGFNLTSGSGNIYVNHEGGVAESGTTRIGTAQTRAFIAGIRGVTTGAANAINVVIDSNGQLGTLSSSREVKDHIADMAGASRDLMKLRPVTFHYKQHGDDGSLQYGLVAEEVAQVYPGLVARTAQGNVETVMYQFLPPMLLNELQRQQRTIEALEARIAELEAHKGDRK